MIIQIPVPVQAEVVRELERALSLARNGRLSGIALSYMAEGDQWDCAQAKDYRHAIQLLGQTNMIRLDIIALVKHFRGDDPRCEHLET